MHPQLFPLLDDDDEEEDRVRRVVDDLVFQSELDFDVLVVAVAVLVVELDEDDVSVEDDLLDVSVVAEVGADVVVEEEEEELVSVSSHRLRLTRCFGETRRLPQQPPELRFGETLRPQQPEPRFGDNLRSQHRVTVNLRSQHFFSGSHFSLHSTFLKHSFVKQI